MEAQGDMKPRKKMGRPSVLTANRMLQLEQAVSWGWSIKNACAFANISERAFYATQQRDPEFKQRIAMLRDMPGLAALRNVTEAVLAGDLAASLWYLERRVPGFALRTKAAVTASGEPLSDAEIRRRLEQLVGRARAVALAE